MADVKCTKLADGSMICWGRKQMVAYPGSEHTREVAFVTPAFENSDVNGCPPVVTATVYAPKSPGTAFVVYNVHVNSIEGPSPRTQISVHAQNMDLRVPSDIEFWCNIVAIGLPLIKSATD